MLRASLKSLLARKLRLLMSAVAVILGVAFVAGSFIFTDTLGRSFDGIMSSSVGDVVVRPAGSGDTLGSTQTIDGALVAKLAAAPGAARADGNIVDYTTFVVGKSGKLIGGQGAPGMAVNFTDGPAANNTSMFSLASGEMPTQDGQIALDAKTAKTGGYVVGDKVNVVTASAKAQVNPTLSGIIESSGSLVGASVVVWTTHEAQSLYLGGKDAFNDVWVTREDGTSQEQLRAAVAPLLPADLEAVTGDSAAEAAANQIQESLKFITYFLLIFAAVALVVGTFIIVNTFSILVAQRMRELALFRAIGASRRQVARSVLIEAFVVGLIGATLGLGLGIVLAIAIKALFGAIGLDLAGAELVLAPRTVVAAYVVGLVVTLLAAYLPARRAGKVPPVAAMRDDVTLTESSMHRRVLAGLALTALGAAALALGLLADVPKPVAFVGAGILGVLLGVALTSPVVGRPLIVGMGAIYRRLFGSVGVMAEENALRNPRRTAATASALMIGVALVSMMAVFGSSTKASINKEIEKNFKADYLVSNSIGSDFSTAVGDEVAKVDGVATVSRVRWGMGEVGDGQEWIAAIDPATFGQVATLDTSAEALANLDRGGLLLDADTATELGLKTGDKVRMKLSGKPFDATVAGTYAATAGSAPARYLLSTKTWDANGGKLSDGQVYVRLTDGADAAAVGSALDKIVADLPTVSVKDVAGYAEEQAKPINQMLMIIYALLGLAVVIAILGIINTLALSVIERTREIGLLRAVGLSRRQLRSMLRLESVVIALLGATLGVVLGVVFGMAIQRALADEGFSTLQIPWVQLVAFVLMAGIVGVLAAVWPGRRAAKLKILDAIGSE
ncbi:ABC transporter permease [Nostocoides jenkinsii]|uniref:Putative ABC transporter integral membrane protein n=1 Tax=Nostocoides jenkinsii Ben 74 TaxID=1193518 RepID=A0A077M9L5_9MICO|nr:ABC transporter permease [Tetrasphaera jenkinsii]CCI53334.1 putative ABC transporter integral membrane protein [Tetrasphaera jenkinsii Ben 74]